MQFQFLGTGGAFDWQVGNSAALLSFRGKRILLDCGHTVAPKLLQLGLTTSLDYILVSHLHDDHAGSLSTLLYYNHFVLGAAKPKLLYPNEAFRRELLAYLQFSMPPEPELYVNLAPLSEVEGIVALDTYGLHVPGMQTFGFAFEESGQYTVFSGDLGAPHFVAEWLGAHGITPACIFHETSFIPGLQVHCYYRDLFPLLDLAPEVYVYHLNPDHNPPDNRIPLVAHQPKLLL